MSNAAIANDFNAKINLKMMIIELINDGLLDEFTAKIILEENKLSKRHPLSIIVAYKIKDPENPAKVFSIDDLMLWLSLKCKLEYINIDPMKINIESVVNVVTHAYANRVQILPIFVDDKTITFAVADPYDLNWVSELERTNKKKIVLKIANPEQISLLLTEVFVVQKEIYRIGSNKGAKQQKLLNDGKLDEFDRIFELSKQKGIGSNDSAVVKVVDWLINYAHNERASDIHLEPKKGLGQIRFRVDGKLRVVFKMDPEAMLNVVSRIKILSEMKIDEKRKPQDGRIKRFLENGKKIEMRLSCVPTYYGEKLVMRIFDHQTTNQTLDFIGFDEEDKKLWHSMISSSQGLILVTGPTGSGKTTTLYTSLSIVATDDVNVCSVEDPIEMTLDSINQIQVQTQIGLTFASAIRAFLRQDPDIIMVGEIRDHETGEAAIQASLTGHLVFSTLHTNGALATIQRLIDLGLPTFLLNSSIKGILAQRLVRRLCHCKKAIPTPEDKWNVLVDNLNIPRPEMVYKAVGCKDCMNSGYSGRMCVYELLDFSDKIKKIIHAKIELSELIQKTSGMFTPFRSNCARKIISGETSLEEVLEIVY